MTNKERLEKIESVKHYGDGASDVLWLIARVKALEVRNEKLTMALKIYAMTNETFPEYGDVARRALSDGEGEK